MKQFTFWMCLTAIIFTSCDIRNGRQQSGSDLTANVDVKTKVALIDSTFNFGKIKEGQKVEFSYRFENTGEHPLIITSASASCGCTIPEKPEKPVAPGETALIKVAFNSKGTGGIIHKEVRVTSNAQPDFPVLILSGEVVNE